MRDGSMTQSRASAAARGLIVESSFTSLAEMAAEVSKGWLPANLVLSQKFDSIEKIRKIRMPVLIVHGAGDRFVPARFSEALYGAAPEPKKLLLVQNGSHNNSMLVGDADYRQALREVFGPMAGPAAGNGDAVSIAPAADASVLVNRARGVGVFVEQARTQD